MSALLKLEALPPDLRDLTPYGHPRRPAGAGQPHPEPWSGPGVSAQVASLQSLILCSGQHQFRQPGLLCQESSCRP